MCCGGKNKVADTCHHRPQSILYTRIKCGWYLVDVDEDPDSAEQLSREQREHYHKELQQTRHEET